MKRVCAAVLLLLAAASGAPRAAEPAAPAKQLEAEYLITWLGLPVYSGRFAIAWNGERYRMRFQAEAQGIEGVVVLLVELDETGAVVRVEVSQPAGHGFDEAAADAVSRMKFSPAITEAGPIPVLFEMPYGFQLTPEVPDEPVELPVNLDGDVVEMGTRNPVAGARVVVDGTDLVATTDDTGHFEVRGVPTGAWLALHWPVASQVSGSVQTVSLSSPQDVPTGAIPLSTQLPAVSQVSSM